MLSVWMSKAFTLGQPVSISSSFWLTPLLKGHRYLGVKNGTNTAEIKPL